MASRAELKPDVIVYYQGTTIKELAL